MSAYRDASGAICGHVEVVDESIDEVIAAMKARKLARQAERQPPPGWGTGEDRPGG